MIRITVELVSARHPSRNRLLGIATIANDGSQGDGETGNYNVTLSKWAPKQAETWLRGRVEGFNRRTRGAWDLIFIALRALVGPRNP